MYVFFCFRTSLFIITSFIYAKLLIVICIAYVISDVVTHSLPLYYYEGFFTYLYGVSILFLLYVFCFLLQESACCGGGPDTPLEVKPTKESKKEQKEREKREKKESKERAKKEKIEKEKAEKERKEKEKKEKKEKEKEAKEKEKKDKEDAKKAAKEGKDSKDGKDKEKDKKQQTQVNNKYLIFFYG